MRYPFLHGIILCVLGSAAAAEPGSNAAKSGAPARSDSSLSSPEKKPLRAKPEKPSTPLAKPEATEEAEPEEDSGENEDSSDCDGCLLA